MPKPMIEDLPYPDLSGLTVDCKNARIIMPAYADSKYAAALEGIAIAEMKHLDMLGEALLRMGVSPTYVRRPPEQCEFYSTCNVDYSVRPAAMLAADITAENEAIRSYEQMLCKIDNPTLNALISRILLDERMHLKAFKEMYCEVVSG